MTVFKGSAAIRAFLEAFDGWLSEPVDVYLLGGSAMTVRGLKDQTEDIDRQSQAIQRAERAGPYEPSS